MIEYDSLLYTHKYMMKYLINSLTKMELHLSSWWVGKIMVDRFGPLGKGMGDE